VIQESFTALAKKRIDVTGLELFAVRVQNEAPSYRIKNSIGGCFLCELKFF
jgi:hypothetical protein